MGIPYGKLTVPDAWWGMKRWPSPTERAMQRPTPLEITHDPMDGFPAGRKPRVMKATYEEMVSAKLLTTQRDYCADKLITLKNCRYLQYPLIYRCEHERHEWDACRHEDYLIRLKEAERERRLRAIDEERAAALAG